MAIALSRSPYPSVYRQNANDAPKEEQQVKRGCRQQPPDKRQRAAATGLYGLFAFDAFDIRTQRLKLVFDTFVAAVNVVNTIDNRRTFRNTARQYQAG